MQVKSVVRKLAGELDQAVGFLSATEVVMQDLGLQCDDRTILQKLQAIDKSAIFTDGASLVSDIYSVYSLLANVKAAVA